MKETRPKTADVYLFPEPFSSVSLLVYRMCVELTVALDIVMKHSAKRL
jgi:hypothetical protein